MSNDEGIDDLTLLRSCGIVHETYPNTCRTGARGRMETHNIICHKVSAHLTQVKIGKFCPRGAPLCWQWHLPFKFLKDSEAGIQAESSILEFPRVLYQNGAAPGELPIPWVGSFFPSQFYHIPPLGSNTYPQQLSLSHPADLGYTHLKWMNQRKTPDKTLEEGVRPFGQVTLGQVPTMMSGRRGHRLWVSTSPWTCGFFAPQGRKKMGKGSSEAHQSWAPQSVLHQQKRGHHLGAR